MREVFAEVSPVEYSYERTEAENSLAFCADAVRRYMDNGDPDLVMDAIIEMDNTLTDLANGSVVRYRLNPEIAATVWLRFAVIGENAAGMLMVGDEL